MYNVVVLEENQIKTNRTFATCSAIRVLYCVKSALSIAIGRRDMMLHAYMMLVHRSIIHLPFYMRECAQFTVQRSFLKRKWQRPVCICVCMCVCLLCLYTRFGWSTAKTTWEHSPIIGSVCYVRNNINTKPSIGMWKKSRRESLRSSTQVSERMSAVRECGYISTGVHREEEEQNAPRG